MDYDRLKQTSLVHIYGFPVDYDEKFELKSPATLFKLAFYGSEDYHDDDGDEKMHYIGIKFGEQKAPFQKLYATQSGTFQISDFEPTEEMKKQMANLYPDKVLSCHSFLQNVYTSHYYTGRIMVGYFILTGEKDVGAAGDVVSEDDKNSDIDFVMLANSLESNFAGFIGKQIGPDFVTFDFSHIDDPGNAFYRLCKKTYNMDDYKDFQITFKPGCLTSQKMIAFVPEMCYCCT